MQIQEALTSQIADTTQEVLRPRFVGVVIEAAHQRMTTRRIREPGVSLATSACSAAFRDDPTRRERPGPRPYQEKNHRRVHLRVRPKAPIKAGLDIAIVTGCLDLQVDAFPLLQAIDDL